MKKVLSIMITTALAYTVSAQNFIDKRPDKEKENLKGSVRQVTEYDIDDVDYFSTDELKQYREQGTTPPTTKKVFKKTTDYNRDGFITKCSFNPEDALSLDYTVSYLDGNKVDKKITYEKDGSIRNTYFFEYDSNGKCIHSEKMTPNKNVIFNEDYFYDNEGRLWRMIHTNNTGSTETFTFEYDNNNDISKMSQKTQYAENVFKLDRSVANPTEVWLSSGNATRHLRMTYDLDGNPFLVEEEVTDTWVPTIVRKFDSYGNTASETTFNTDGTTERIDTMEYEYDSYGNWTRLRRSSTVNYMNFTKEREIAYY